MATTFTGGATFGVSGQNTLSGNESGTASFGASKSVVLATGAASPQVESGGGYSGTFTAVTGGTLLNLANGSNIVISGGAGSIAPAQGYVITAVKKLRTLYLENTDGTNTVTVSCPATLFLAGVGWVASQVVVTLQPGGAVQFVFPAGSSVLTSGANDGLSFVSSAGSPVVRIAATFG